MTNFERIKNMSIEEMTECEELLMCPHMKDGCIHTGEHNNINESVATCKECIREWLESEEKS